MLGYSLGNVRMWSENGGRKFWKALNLKFFSLTSQTNQFKLNQFFCCVLIQVRVSGILQYKQFIDPNNTVKNHGRFKIHLSVPHPHSLDYKKCLKNSTGSMTKRPAFYHFKIDKDAHSVGICMFYSASQIQPRTFRLFYCIVSCMV
jgi:hypothetical protein